MKSQPWSASYKWVEIHGLNNHLLTIKQQFIFKLLQNKPLYWCYKVSNHTLLLRKWFPTCSSSSMKIVDGSSRQIEVVYMSRFGQVDSPGHYVSCYNKITSSLSHFLHPKQSRTQIQMWYESVLTWIPSQVLPSSNILVTKKSTILCFGSSIVRQETLDEKWWYILAR